MLALLHNSRGVALWTERCAWGPAQLEVCKEQVEWARTEKRNFLRQRIEARLATLYLGAKDYPAALALISRLLVEARLALLSAPHALAHHSRSYRTAREACLPRSPVRPGHLHALSLSSRLLCQVRPGSLIADIISHPEHALLRQRMEACLVTLHQGAKLLLALTICLLVRPVSVSATHDISQVRVPVAAH